MAGSRVPPESCPASQSAVHIIMASKQSTSKGENPLDLSLERELNVGPVSSQSAVDGVMVARQSTSKEENPLDLSLEKKT